MLTVLKAVSGSVDLLALCCVVGLFLSIVGLRRLARGWLFTAYLLFMIGGIPAVARGIASHIPAAAPTHDVSALANTDVLIVLDGDNPHGRIREAAAILRRAHPRIVVVSGRPVFADRIRAAAVPASRFLVETAATTTREQIAFVDQFVRRERAQTPTLVVSCLSVVRVDGLLRKARLSIRVAAGNFDDVIPDRGYQRWMPTLRSVEVSRDSVYEILALRYYFTRGWLESPRRPPSQ